MMDFLIRKTTLINNITHENDEIVRLKYKLKISSDAIEKIHKVIRDDKQEIESRENKIKNYKNYLNLFI
jgi:predicted  nucleic acid-binding Zn-ribbon protein